MEINDLIESTLTEEEKIILSKIEEKIAKELQKIAEHKYDHLDNDDPLDLSEKHPEVIPKVHITDAPHEIKISVVLEVSSINDKGYLDEVKEIIQKNYHIPVSSGQDYTKIAEKFFSVFELKLKQTCDEIIKPQFNKNEQ